MPPRPPLANTVKVEANWTGPNATKATNIYYCLCSAPVTSIVQLQTFGSGVVTAYSPSQASVGIIVAPGWTLASVTVLDNSGATENSVTTVANQAGSASGTAYPPNCAQVVSWSIPAHYRGGHPRMYIPGVPTSATTVTGGNQLTTAWRTGLSTFASNFLHAFTTAFVAGITQQIGTISYKRNGEPLATPNFYPFSGGTIHGRLDSQRRRLGKEALFP